jgi:hypothetical protein
MIEGTWGTEITYNDDIHATGGRSLEITSEGADYHWGFVMSEYIPITASRYLVCEFYTKSSEYHNDHRADVWVRWYDKDKTLLKDWLVGGPTPSETEWKKFAFVGVPQIAIGQYPRVRYMRYGIRRNNSNPSAGDTYSIFVDRCHVYEGNPYYSLYVDLPATVASGSPQRLVCDRGSNLGEIVTAARGTIAFTGQPTATETWVFNATTMTAVSGTPATDQFQIGASVPETAQNCVDMLNSGTESSGVIAWREGKNVVMERVPYGLAGNSITFTEALTNATADGSGTLGGTQLGGIWYGANSSTTYGVQGRINIFLPGRYSLQWHVAVSDLGSGSFFETMIRKNGTTVAYGSSSPGGTSKTRSAGAAVFGLAKDDYLEIWVEHDHGAWVLPIVGGAIIALGGWVANNFLGHGTRLAVAETKQTAIEKKVDRLDEKVDDANTKLDTLIGRETGRREP